MKILLTVFATSLLTSFSTIANQLHESSTPPVIIAVHKTVDIKFSPTQSAQWSINSQESVQEFTIESAGASFIKVHFKSFNIPDGAYIVVSDNASTESYLYDNESTAKRTFNTLVGENGFNQFSAMSVFGETAKVKLVLPLGIQWLPEHELIIDSYKAGTEGEFSVTPSELMNSLTVAGNIDQTQNFEIESTCGINERKDVQCWASSNPIEYERTRPVARLLMAGSGLCTAWRVGSQNHMFTNNHCLDNEARLQDTEVWFNYQHMACDGSTLDNVIKVTGKTLFKTDYTLDYSVFSVNSFAAIAGFGYFGLDVRTPTQGEQIYIPQHGSGNPKELSIQSDQNSGGLCQIDVSSANSRGTGTDTGYFCDTVGGSSGSPVLASSSNNVIALHHFGGCENQGVRVDKIWPQVANIFGNSVPVGDNNSDGNQEPVPVITNNCNNLTCTFSGASSSDTDGTITSYQWSFGDGNSASENQTQHSYDTSGSYTASLTVTDNGGLSSSVNKVISVSSGDNNSLTSGVTVNNLSGAKANEQDFYIDTTTVNTRVDIQLSGGSGDADLYVKKGSVPTKTDYDCRPFIGGNNESCDVLLASPGRVYIRLIGYSAYNGASLLATNTVSTPNEYPKENLTATTNNWLRHVYTATQNETVNVSINGGSGDADLYINKTGEPTDNSYTCRPYLSGNNESCSVTLSVGEALYIGIKAYSTFAGTTLNITP